MGLTAGVKGRLTDQVAVSINAHSEQMLRTFREFRCVLLSCCFCLDPAPETLGIDRERTFVVKSAFERLRLHGDTWLPLV